jgi:hypothetical protein
MRPTTRIAAALLLVCALLRPAPSPAAAPHKFYTSLARVEYNAAGKSVEVTLRVFADDLERALGRREGREVRLDRKDEADRLVPAYLRDKFELKNRDGEVKALKWVGMELSAGQAWLYVEADMPEGLSGARLRDHLFFELFAGQVNTVSVRYPGASADLVFVPGDGERVVPAPRG